MNPHSHDYRDTMRAGEKTGDPLQIIPNRQRPSAWLWFSTTVTIGVFLFLLAALPWEGGW